MIPSFLDIVAISSQRFLAAESPVWDDAGEQAYFVDIKGHLLCAFSPAHGTLVDWPTGEDIGFVALTDTPWLILGLRSGLVLFNPLNGQKQRWIQMPLASDERLNDGKIGPDGALYFGKMSMDAAPGRGVLYRLDSTLDLTIVAEGYQVPNGPAFARNGSLFHCDTPKGVIHRLTRDGQNWRQDVAIELPRRMGGPDGIAVDPEGRLWAGLWGGHGLWVGQDRNVEAKVLSLPARYVTSLCPVGNRGDQVLVTSAYGPISRGEGAVEPDDGRVFLVQINFRWPARSDRFALSRSSLK